jgi:hypothetical protein
MAEVTEVVTKFSFTGSTAPLGKYNEQLAGAIKGLGAFAAASTAAVAGAALWANSIFQAIDPLEQLSRRIGVNIEAIQELGFAASVNGGSIEGMSASLEGLTERIGEAAALGTGEGVAIFEKLGIDIEDANGQAKAANVIFDELRQRIVELDLDETQTLSIARKLGMTPDAVQLLLKTNQEMAGLRERARDLGIVVGGDAADAVADYNDNVTIMNHALTGLKREIAIGFLPKMSEMVTGFTELIAVNRDLISDIVSRTITAITGVAKAFFNVGMAVFDVISALMKFEPVMWAAITVAGILMVQFMPITSIVALVTTLVLVIDDLLVALTGGKSVIGDFFKSFGLNLEYVGNTLMWVFDLFKSILNLDFGMIGNLMTKTVAFNYNDAVRADFQGRGGDTVNNRNVSQDIKIDIRAADPTSAGRAVQDSLQRQLNDADAQTGGGGL